MARICSRWGNSRNNRTVIRNRAMNIELLNNADKNLNIKYQVHVQNIGWQGEKQNGEMAGTTGESLKIEA